MCNAWLTVLTVFRLQTTGQTAVRRDTQQNRNRQSIQTDQRGHSVRMACGERIGWSTGSNARLFDFADSAQTLRQALHRFASLSGRSIHTGENRQTVQSGLARLSELRSIRQTVNFCAVTVLEDARRCHSVKSIKNVVRLLLRLVDPNGLKVPFSVRSFPMRQDRSKEKKDFCFYWITQFEILFFGLLPVQNDLKTFLKSLKFTFRKIFLSGSYHS